jgi:hypothetical protein
MPESRDELEIQSVSVSGQENAGHWAQLLHFDLLTDDIRQSKQARRLQKCDAWFSA